MPILQCFVTHALSVFDSRIEPFGTTATSTAVVRLVDSAARCSRRPEFLAFLRRGDALILGLYVSCLHTTPPSQIGLTRHLSYFSVDSPSDTQVNVSYPCCNYAADTGTSLAGIADASL